jgi:hypothetical protein
MSQQVECVAYDNATLIFNYEEKHKMKRTFEIYPALFLITTRCSQGRIPEYLDLMKSITYHETKEDRSTFYLRIDNNDCLFNTTHTQVMLTLGKKQRLPLAVELPDELLGKLKAKTVTGKKFTITYVPVLN